MDDSIDEVRVQGEVHATTCSFVVEVDEKSCAVAESNRDALTELCETTDALIARYCYVRKYCSSRVHRQEWKEGNLNRCVIIITQGSKRMFKTRFDGFHQDFELNVYSSQPSLHNKF